MDHLSIKKYLEGFEHFTSNGWEFLLQDREYKELAIDTLSKILDHYQKVEFRYNNLYYEIFDSSNGGYMVNIYSEDEKDEDNCYLDEYLVDGGLCTGSCKDAIEFML